MCYTRAHSSMAFDSVLIDHSEEALRDEPIEVNADPCRHPAELDAAAVDSDAVKVVKRLQRYGHEAYLVGGGVRDLLLGRKPKDFDVATDARPREIRSLFRNCRIVGRRFRLGHVFFAGGKIIEVATFRRDPKGESWEPGSEGADDNERDQAIDQTNEPDVFIMRDNVYGRPDEDARRRDFTINGLFYDLSTHEVIDYVNGLPDLHARTVRTIGDPDLRFREDPVRMLRAVKFGARLGFELDRPVEQAIYRQREQLLRCAKPRLLEELLRLLRSGASAQAFDLCDDTHILEIVLPELTTWLRSAPVHKDELTARLSHVDAVVQEGQLPEDALLMLLLFWGPLRDILHSQRNPGQAVYDYFAPLVERFTLPRKMRERMRQLSIAYKRSGSRKGPVRHRDHRSAGRTPRNRYTAEGPDSISILLQILEQSGSKR